MDMLFVIDYELEIVLVKIYLTEVTIIYELDFDWHFDKRVTACRVLNW